MREGRKREIAGLRKVRPAIDARAGRPHDPGGRGVGVRGILRRTCEESSPDGHVRQTLAHKARDQRRLFRKAKLGSIQEPTLTAKTADMRISLLEITLVCSAVQQ